MFLDLQSLPNKQEAEELYIDAYQNGCIECANVLAKAGVSPKNILYMLEDTSYRPGVPLDVKNCFGEATDYVQYICRNYMREQHQATCIPMIIGFNSQHHPLYTRDVLRSIIHLAQPDPWVFYVEGKCYKLPERK